MGRTNVYADGRRVYVVPLLQSSINYGFVTKIDASEGGELGQQDADGANVPIFFGLNSPTPARFQKKATGYSITSFGDANTQIQGWKRIKRASFKKVSVATTNVKYVKVPLNANVDYAWPMPLFLYTNIGDARAGLGISDLTNTDTALKKCVWGANKSDQPPKAQKIDATAGNIYTTFYDASKSSLPTGWAAVGGGRGQE